MTNKIIMYIYIIWLPHLQESEIVGRYDERSAKLLYKPVVEVAALMEEVQALEVPAPVRIMLDY